MHRLHLYHQGTQRRHSSKTAQGPNNFELLHRIQHQILLRAPATGQQLFLRLCGLCSRPAGRDLRLAQHGLRQHVYRNECTSPVLSHERHDESGPAQRSRAAASLSVQSRQELRWHCCSCVQRFQRVQRVVQGLRRQRRRTGRLALRGA